MVGLPSQPPSIQSACSRSLAFAVGVILLAPYATLRFSFTTALYVQAALILTSVLGLVAIGWRSWRFEGPWERLPSAPAIGAGLFATAAVLGALVGEFREAAPRDLAGQLLSMGLLPMSILAGAACGASRQRRSLAWALVAAATGACWLHFAAGALTLSSGRPPGRMILAHGVTAAGPALIALPLALALALSEAGRAGRIAGSVAFASLIAYGTGSGTRSLWLVLPVAVVGFFVLSGHWRRLVGGKTVVVLAGGVVLATLAVLGVERWITSAGAPLFDRVSPRLAPSQPPAWPGSDWRVLAPARDPLPGELYRLKVCRTDAIPNGGAARVVWLGADGAFLGALRIDLALSPSGRRSCTTAFGTPPAAAVAGRLELAPGLIPTTPRLDQLSLARIGSGPGVWAGYEVHRQIERLRSLPSLFAGSSGLDDESETIRFRWLESERLFELFRQAGWTERLLGHGLGARFELGLHGWNNRGDWVYYDRVNYVHNFYAFLLFKLGLLGTALVLAALALWIGWSLLRVRTAGSTLERSLVAAVAAAWLAAALWSFSSPVFLDFRLAPLWGLSIAALGDGRTLPSDAD